MPVEVIALPKRWVRGFSELKVSVGIGAYGCSRGPYAIEHVGAECYGYYQVFGISYAHHIAWFVLR